jgi:hypothetical protein
MPPRPIPTFRPRKPPIIRKRPIIHKLPKVKIDVTANVQGLKDFYKDLSDNELIGYYDRLLLPPMIIPIIEYIDPIDPKDSVIVTVTVPSDGSALYFTVGIPK